MTEKIAWALDGLKRALETLHPDQRHIARRNARRRAFGELLKLKHIVQRDFPNVTPWPEGWPAKPAKHPTAGKRWRYVEYEMLKPRRSWDTAVAQWFVNAWAAKIGQDPLTVTFNLLGGGSIGRFVLSAGQIQMRAYHPGTTAFARRRLAADYWRTLMHECAHYRGHGHGAEFVAELWEVYLFFRSNAWLRAEPKEV